MSDLDLSNFKSFQIEHKDVIDDIINNYQPKASEYCFAYLFAWQNHFHFKWTIHNDFLLILGKKDNNFYCLSPIGNGDRIQITLEVLNWLSTLQDISHPYIDRVDNKFISDIKHHPDIFVRTDRDYYDYIYTSANLINLKGRKYHAKRNHIHNFKENHSFEYEKIKSENLINCRQIAEKWCKMKNCDENSSLQAEKEALFRVLNNFDDLGMSGGLISVDGSYEAFTIGEKLNNEMAVVHYEKADPNIQGLYQIINQKYCEKEWQNVKYINREQDMGIPGIRKAKKSYHPEFFVKKYTISLQ